MTDLVWLWVVYRVDSDAVFGAIRRAERLYRTAEEARSVVGQVAERMGADEIRWDQTDEGHLGSEDHEVRLGRMEHSAT